MNKKKKNKTRYIQYKRRNSETNVSSNHALDLKEKELVLTIIQNSLGTPVPASRQPADELTTLPTIKRNIVYISHNMYASLNTIYRTTYAYT